MINFYSYKRKKQLIFFLFLFSLWSFNFVFSDNSGIEAGFNSWLYKEAGIVSGLDRSKEQKQKKIDKITKANVRKRTLPNKRTLFKIESDSYFTDNKGKKYYLVSSAEDQKKNTEIQSIKKQVPGGEYLLYPNGYGNGKPIGIINKKGELIGLWDNQKGKFAISNGKLSFKEITQSDLKSLRDKFSKIQEEKKRMPPWKPEIKEDLSVKYQRTNTKNSGIGNLQLKREIGKLSEKTRNFKADNKETASTKRYEPVSTLNFTSHCKKIDKNGFVKFGGCTQDGKAEKGGFIAFMKMFNDILKWIAKLAIFIAVMAGFYAGGLYVFSAADPGQKSKAKNMFKGIAIGLLLVFFGFLIIKLVLDTFAVGKSTGKFSGLNVHQSN